MTEHAPKSVAAVRDNRPSIRGPLLATGTLILALAAQALTARALTALQHTGLADTQALAALAHQVVQRSH